MWPVESSQEAKYLVPPPKFPSPAEGNIGISHSLDPRGFYRFVASSPIGETPRVSVAPSHFSLSLASLFGTSSRRSSPPPSSSTQDRELSSLVLASHGHEGWRAHRCRHREEKDRWTWSIPIDGRSAGTVGAPPATRSPSPAAVPPSPVTSFSSPWTNLNRQQQAISRVPSPWS